jgi:hypothetical protein
MVRGRKDEGNLAGRRQGPIRHLFLALQLRRQ